MSQPNPSTGPRTEEGKARSSQNARKHGLASETLLIPGEDAAEFDDLVQAFLHEHRPISITEKVLVLDMAKAWWLKERALRYQARAFESGEPDLKQLALFLRYQTTNERAFHKALKTLRELQSQTQPADEEFVSQNGEEDLPDTPETLDRDMAAIQRRLAAFCAANPEAAERAQTDPDVQQFIAVPPAISLPVPSVPEKTQTSSPESAAD